MLRERKKKGGIVREERGGTEIQREGEEERQDEKGVRKRKHMSERQILAVSLKLCLLCWQLLVFDNTFFVYCTAWFFRIVQY